MNKKKLNRKNIFLVADLLNVLLLFFLVIFMEGSLLNHIVMENNNGKMPVKILDLEYKTKCVQTSYHFSYQNNNEINFWYLSDIYKTPTMIFSIGDFFVWLGFYTALFLFLITELYFAIILFILSSLEGDLKFKNLLKK